jgi:hypothetical protein
MPIGICVHCGRDYYLAGVVSVADYPCDACGRPLVPVEALTRQGEEGGQAAEPQRDPPEEPAG